MNQIRALVILLLCLFLSACALSEAGLPTPPPLPVPDVLPVSTNTATAASIPAATPDATAIAEAHYAATLQANQTQNAAAYLTGEAMMTASSQDKTEFAPTKTPTTASQTPMSSPTPMPLIPPPVGLVYQTGEGWWRINASGQAQLRLPVSDSEEILTVSPDATFALIATPPGQWPFQSYFLINLSTGERIPLRFDNSTLCSYERGWISTPETALVYIIQPLEHATGYACYGMPAVITTDGRVLPFASQGNSWSLLDQSPDGSRFAFELDRLPFLFDYWSSSFERFNPNEYGYIEPDTYFITPSWSPSGNFLAWAVTTPSEQGIVIFDLKNHSSRFLSPYTFLRGEGRAVLMCWSADEKYIYAEGSGGADEGYIITVDGSNATYFAPYGFYPSCSPKDLWFTTYYRRSVNIYSYDGTILFSQAFYEPYIISTAWVDGGSYLLLQGSEWNWASDTLDYTYWLLEAGTWLFYQLDLPTDVETVYYP